MTDTPSSIAPPAVWMFGPYSLDADGHLCLGPAAVPLSPLQRRLLLALVGQAGKVIEKNNLLDQVWGHRQVSDVSLARAVHGLRRILDQGPLGGGVIHTIYGSGYRLDVPARLRAVADLSQPSPASASFPGGQALGHFVEGLVQLRQRDPRRLAGAERHFQRCLELSPTFGPAQLHLAATHLGRHLWGQVPASAVDAEIEDLLVQAEASGCEAEPLLALRVEALSLLHWQPQLVEERFASWLPAQLTAGPPRHSWALHLLVTGRPAQARDLLRPHLLDDHPSGWMLSALAAALAGDRHGAIEALSFQLGLDASLLTPRLLLALLLAEAGQPSEALDQLSFSGVFDAPSESFLALPALVLAKAGAGGRAALLLDQAVARPAAKQSMASLWGAVALTLGQQERAVTLLEQAVRSRCGLAPFLLAWPTLADHDDTAAVRGFRSGMARSFGSFALLAA
ncbi:MAG: winged helix-turn-helix domain-containing protein [Cyanobium sp. ELA507]